ncbi:MAG: hypothetical protein KDK39_05580 [Leptospiraceae bacterium]|nr:hypothetical protein [Leptospiraceae bacterium]
MVNEKNMNQLRKDLSVMARKCQDIFSRAILLIHKSEEAEIARIRELDHGIDEYEVQIDALCQEILIKEAYAREFRYVIAALKTVSDLERIGDQSKTIAKWTPRLDSAVHVAMDSLVEKTREALNLAVEALLENRIDAANRVMELEFQVDAIEDQIIESTDNIAEAFIAKALERIGDLATNIAENVIYALKAEDVRHGGWHA